MKKSKKEEKGFLELAGEAMTVLGHEIVEGKDKLMDVASEKITAVKKAIKKISKKKKAVVPKAKSIPVKKVAKKAVKKTAPKVIRKTAKKKTPAKKK
jgi:hypothetical protein